MRRRDFLAAVASLAALTGCGGSNSDVGSGFAGGNPLAASQEVSGRIAPELIFSGAVIGSAYGPSTVTGDSFTTSVSSTTVGLLSLGDGTGGVRGFSLTMPGETPVFSAENSALAILFLQPGFLRLEPDQARALIAQIRASSAFAPFVQLLLTQAPIRRLDLLSGDASYLAALEALLLSLGNPFSASLPTVSRSGKTVILNNGSPRFLRVVADGVVLPQMVPPYGRLSDPVGATSYTFHGLGPASGLPADTSLIETTYFPTLVFAVLIPWLELTLGQKLPVELGLQLMERLRTPAFDPRADLVDATTLTFAMSEDLPALVEDLDAAITAGFPNLVEGAYYDAGLVLVVEGVTSMKQWKEDPTGHPVGAGITLVFVGISLIFLPSILDEAGGTIFGGSEPTQGPPF